MKKEYFIKDGYNDENVFAYLYMEFNDYDEMHMRNALQNAEISKLKEVNIQFMKNIIDYYGFDKVISQLKKDITQNGSFNYDFSAEREDETYPLEQAIIDTFADAIKDDIVIDKESYEPVDTEGHIVDGYAQYKGERFEFTDVFENNTPSYEITAAITYIERKLNNSDMKKEMNKMPNKNDKTVSLHLHYYVCQGVSIPDELEEYEGDELINKCRDWFEKNYETDTLQFYDFDGEYFDYTFDCDVEVPSRLAADFLNGKFDAVREICGLAEQQNGEIKGFNDYYDYLNLTVSCDKWEKAYQASEIEAAITFIEDYENDGSAGYSLTKYYDDTTYSKAVMITKSDADVTVPYVYAVSGGDISENALSSASVKAMEYDARKDLIRKIARLSDFTESEWAQSVLNVNKELEQLVKKVDDHTKMSDRVEYTSPDGYKVEIELCRDMPEEDFSFFICEDDNVGCAYDLLELAGNIVNHEGNERNIEISKKKLNEFYNEKISPCISKSSKELTDEDRENLQSYSDWHKDLYGVRPKLTFGKSSREGEERE